MTNATKHFLTIDNGGTNTKVIIVDQNGRQLSVSSFPTDAIERRPGFREVNPGQMWRDIGKAVKAALESAGLDGSQIDGVVPVGHGKGLYVLGKDGKPRELHVKKAVDVSVTEPPKYDIKPIGDKVIGDGFDSTLLTKCDLFTVNHYDVEKSLTLEADEKSFNHVLVIDGEGKINGKALKKGDSFFIPAGFGKYEICGKCEIIVTNI